MSKFAVIDTETNWYDEVMSIGIVVSDPKDLLPSEKKYYILTPFKNIGGMYSGALYINGLIPDLEGSREAIMSSLLKFLNKNGVGSIFAYNAKFDHGHLPELGGFDWFDIMKLTAYRQYNGKIPKSADCYKTGRMKTGYGVENMYRILSGNSGYCETHNALRDALDELEIMRLLGLPIEKYETAKINDQLTMYK